MVCVYRVCAQLVSCVWFFVTAAHQAPLSTGFPRQEYWSRLLFPSPGDLPDAEAEPMSPALAGRFFTIERPEEPSIGYTTICLSIY